MNYSLSLSKEDKEEIKEWCKIFRAKRIWIEGIEVNVPKIENKENE